MTMNNNFCFIVNRKFVVDIFDFFALFFRRYFKWKCNMIFFIKKHIFINKHFERDFFFSNDHLFRFLFFFDNSLLFCQEIFCVIMFSNSILNDDTNDRNILFCFCILRFFRFKFELSIHECVISIWRVFKHTFKFLTFLSWTLFLFLIN